jgi:hypothetical protein
MSWVLIYIASNFLAPIPFISLGIINFLFQFPPKSTNISTRISRKVANRLKPELRPAKAGTPAKAGPSPAKAGHHLVNARRVLLAHPVQPLGHSSSSPPQHHAPPART